MEKGIEKIEVVQSLQGEKVVFQLKDPKTVNRTILSKLREEISLPNWDSYVIYPDQRIIESNQLFIEGNSKII